MEQNNSFDVIIIGSGIGGLTTAALLAKWGKKKVLVIERHIKLGGYSHSFTRKGKYSWDVGVHYVGDMGQGSLVRLISDEITNSKLDWVPKQGLHFIYPDLNFPFHPSMEEYQKELIKTFPDEAQGIEQYLSDMNKVFNWFIQRSSVEAIPDNLKRSGFQAHPDLELALKNLHEYFEELKFPLKLQAILDSQWPGYGLTSKDSTFLAHTLMILGTLKGIYYPVGGSQKISEGVVPVIEELGGSFMTQTEVKEILVEDNKARGVVVRKKDGEEIKIFSDIVVSNAGVPNTYLKLLSHMKFPFEETLKKLSNESPSGVSLFLGLKKTHREFGIKGDTFWIYENFDHEINAQRRGEILKDFAPMLGIAFIEGSNGKLPTAQAYFPIDAKIFAPWKGTPYHKRGEDYEKLKEVIVENFLKLLEKHFPGIREIVEYTEVGSPLTFEHFVSHMNGHIHGTPFSKDKCDFSLFDTKTPVKDLFITGADIAPGVAGAMFSGALCTSQILGPRIFIKLLKAWKKP